MTHPFTPHSTDHELIRFEIWQSPLQFYWTANKIHLLNSSAFLQSHQETFPLIWSFLSVPVSLLFTCGDAGSGPLPPLSTSYLPPYLALGGVKLIRESWVHRMVVQWNCPLKLLKQSSLHISGFVAPDCPFMLTYCSTVCGQHVVHVRSTCGQLRTQESSGNDSDKVSLSCCFCKDIL